jgi:undecaprenyl-diphosphatase
MFQWLNYIDQQLIQAIHALPSTAWLDAFVVLLRNKETWIPLYFALAAFLVYKARWQALVWIAGILLCFLVTDQLSSHLIKPLLERPRPCHDAELLRHLHLLVNCGSGYSMPSSHATNHFGLAMFLSLLFRHWGYRHNWPWLIWAVSIGFAQIYVGVHYPSDVIVGAFLGAWIGIGLFFVAKLASNKLFSPIV